MASVNIEKKIETAWMTLLSENAYIIANGIPVQSWYDNSEVKNSGEIVVVHSPRVRNEFGNNLSPLWMNETEIMSVTYQADDRNLNLLNTLYEECLGVVIQKSLTDLDTAAGGGIKFNGRMIVNEGEELMTEKGFQAFTVKIECHVQLI